MGRRVLFGFGDCVFVRGQKVARNCRSAYEKCRQIVESVEPKRIFAYRINSIVYMTRLRSSSYGVQAFLMNRDGGVVYSFVYWTN